MKKVIALFSFVLFLSIFSNAKHTNNTDGVVFEKSITIHLHFDFFHKIKRLKRKLLRNLFLDELIDSKNEFVKIELPEGKIIVNGKSLEGKLYKKYEGIIQNFEVGHGEKRGIQISPSFIKVGDFYPDCFRGEASGKFEISLCGDDKKKKSLF